MSLAVTTRPLTDTERAKLESFKRPQLGLLLMCMIVLLLTVIFAGFANAFLKRLGVDEQTRAVCYLIVGLVAGVVWHIREVLADRRYWAHYEAAHRSALADGVVQQIVATPLRIWGVDDVEDMGPAYLIDPGTDQVVFICSQELPYENELGVIPMGQISADAIPYVDTLLKLELGAGEIRPEPGDVSINDLGLTVFSQLVLLPRSVLDLVSQSEREMI